MDKRAVEGIDGLYWVWEMPEIAQEIPSLMSAAGKVRVKSLRGNTAVVSVDLRHPAKVVDWKHQWGDGVAINSTTSACICGGPSVEVLRLPREGDRKVSLKIKLELYTYEFEKTVTLHDMRRHLRALALQMTKTWYYYF